jgi:hypothetical protein
MGRGLLTARGPPPTCVLVLGRLADLAIDPSTHMPTDHGGAVLAYSGAPGEPPTLYLKQPVIDRRLIDDKVSFVSRIIVACDLRNVKDLCWSCGRILVDAVEARQQPAPVDVTVLLCGGVSFTEKAMHEVTRRRVDEFITSLRSAKVRVSTAPCETPNRL